MESSEARGTLALQRRPGAYFAQDSADDWGGLSSSQLRRKIQNRINQRACRHRKASATRQSAIKHSSSSAEESARAVRSSKTRQTVPRDGGRRCAYGHRIQGEPWAAPGLNGLLPTPTPSLDTLRCLSPILEDAGNRRLFYLMTQQVIPIMSERYSPSNEKMTNLVFRLNILEPAVLEMTIGSVAEWTLRRRYSPAVEEAKCKSAMRLIRLVRDGLQQSSEVVSDATLVGMMALSWRPAHCCPHPGPLRGLFRDIGIDHLGAHENLAHYEFSEEHWAAFLYCVKMRGGIENIHLGGTSETFTLADNVNAAVTGNAPTIGLSKAFQHVFQTWLPQVRPPLAEVAAFPVNDDLKELLLDLRVCCQEIEEYAIRVKKMGDTGSTGMVVPYQNIVQHRLMSLRRGGGEGGEGSAEDICRAAALVFTLGVTFPLPRAEPLANAAADLGRAMRSSSKTQSRPFLFWAAMLGAIATGAAEASAAGEGNTNAKLYRFFLEQTKRHRGELGLTTWGAARTMLKMFVWLDRACDEGAWKVWTKSLRPTQAATGKQTTTQDV